MKKFITLLLFLVLLAPITGELWRLPLLGFEFLPSDLLIPPLFILWGIDKIRTDRQFRFGKIGRTVILFLFVLVTTYIINFYRFDPTQMVVAFSYLGRFAMYLILVLISFDLLERDKKLRPRLILVMLASMVSIALFGFLQLTFFPSFLELGLHLDGWDPHIGRLLSTWFDPNFVGGYLAFMLGLSISLTLYFRKKGIRKLFFVLLCTSVLGLVALYLTFSRSGYLALILTLTLLALFKSRKLLVGGALIVLLAFTFSPRVQERSLDAVDSAKSLLGLDSQKPLDPTAELRVWSWSFAREMIYDHPWIGVGYGRYAYEINARGHGLLSDHDAGGSDSSLLTIWAMSGLFGLLSYLSIGFVATAISLKRLWKKHDLRSYVDSGLVSGFGGMMIHSMFVNSLLFPLMMVYLLVGLGLLDER